MEKKKPHSPPIETQSHKHTCHILGLPCSRGPKCSAAGEGGGEGGKFVVSSTTKWDKGRGRNSINIYFIYISHIIRDFEHMWAFIWYKIKSYTGKDQHWRGCSEHLVKDKWGKLWNPVMRAISYQWIKMQIKLKRVMHFLIALPEQLGLTMVRLKKKVKMDDAERCNRRYRHVYSTHASWCLHYP